MNNLNFPRDTWPDDMVGEGTAKQLAKKIKPLDINIRDPIARLITFQYSRPSINI